MHWEDPERGTEWVYLTYSKDEPGNDKRSATALVRAEWRADAKALGPLEDLFVALPYEGTHHHYGARRHRRGRQIVPDVRGTRKA